MTINKTSTQAARPLVQGQARVGREVGREMATDRHTGMAVQGIVEVIEWPL